LSDAAGGSGDHRDLFFNRVQIDGASGCQLVWVEARFLDGLRIMEFMNHYYKFPCQSFHRFLFLRYLSLRLREKLFGRKGSSAED
jgi:hypothetical protein